MLHRTPNKGNISSLVAARNVHLHLIMMDCNHSLTLSIRLIHCRTAGAYPSWPQAQGRVYPGQVTNSSQGQHSVYTHAYGQFRVANWPNLSTFWLWTENQSAQRNPTHAQEKPANFVRKELLVDSSNSSATNPNLSLPNMSFLCWESPTTQIIATQH